jgi:hypothetical protein
MRLLLAPIGAIILLVLSTSPAWAGAGEAERYRLRTELENLARKNAWSGVDRTYQELLQLGLTLELSDYVLGSQAALQQGNLLEGLSRLQVGLAAATPSDDPSSEYAQAKALATGIQERFGQVRIRVGECLPVLILQPLPFAQDERDAFTRAREQILSLRSFHGLLPVGDYKIDTQAFRVDPGVVREPIEVCMPTP